MSAIYVVKAVLQELKLKWEFKKKIKEFSKKPPTYHPTTHESYCLKYANNSQKKKKIKNHKQ